MTKDDAFLNEGHTPPKTIEGKGQMVYWRDCEIEIYDTPHPQRPVEKIKPCTGEGRAQHGTSLWFGWGEGTQGRIREG